MNWLLLANYLSTLKGASNPLEFLLHPDGADSVIDACYRYARHTDGADVVLFGTSSLEHLESNLASIAKPALPEADVTKIEICSSTWKALASNCRIQVNGSSGHARA